MFNYQIIIEYLGTNYVGWQIQKNGASVQSIIQKTLKKVLKSKIKIIGSGRTDAGVHAKGQSANFIYNQEIKNKYKFLSSMNFFLKDKSISIIKINKKNINFNARHKVKKKRYKYIILNRLITSPLYENRSWLIKKKLDIIQMKKGIKFFFGKTQLYSNESSIMCSEKPYKNYYQGRNKKKGKQNCYNF